MKEFFSILMMAIMLFSAISCGDSELNFAGEMSLKAGTLTYSTRFDCEGVDAIRADIKTELVKVSMFKKSTQEGTIKSMSFAEVKSMQTDVKSNVWCTGIVSFISNALPVAHKPSYKCKISFQSVGQEVLTKQICERFWGNSNG